MKIYCKTLSNREANRALAERERLTTEYQIAYRQYKLDSANYQDNLKKAKEKARDILSERLGIERSAIKWIDYVGYYIHFNVDYEYSIQFNSTDCSFRSDDFVDIDKIISVINHLNNVSIDSLFHELVPLFPAQPVKPTEPKFTDDDSKDINRQLITSLVGKDIWTKVSYKKPVRSPWSNEYFIRVTSINSSGKKCWADTISASTVKYWKEYGNDNDYRGRELMRYISRKELLTGNIQIATPREVYTTEELKEMCAQEETK